MVDKNLLNFINTVLEALLSGEENNIELEKLKNQYKNSKYKNIKFTGPGLFVYLDIQTDAFDLISNTKFHIGDVNIKINKDIDADAVLFVDEGKLNFLELYVYVDDWPQKIDEFEITYKDAVRSIKWPV